MNPFDECNNHFQTIIVYFIIMMKKACFPNASNVPVQRDPIYKCLINIFEMHIGTLNCLLQ